MSGQEKDWDKSKTRRYYDEFFGEYDYGSDGLTPYHKRQREFGCLAWFMINRTVEKLFAKYQPTLPDGNLLSPEECADEFFADKRIALENAMRNPKTQNDAAFEGYVTSTANGWFLNRYAQTSSGKMRDMVKSRLNKAKDRFTNKTPNHYWGLVGGPDTPSTASERELRPVVSQYPIDINHKALTDSDRKRMPPYGKKGQMENLLEGVLDAADGTLPLDTLFHLVQYRLPALARDKTVSLTADEDNPIDLPSSAPSAEDAALEQIEGDEDNQWVEDLAKKLSGHSRAWQQNYICKRPAIRRKLINSNNPAIRAVVIVLKLDSDEQKA